MGRCICVWICCISAQGHIVDSSGSGDWSLALLSFASSAGGSGVTAAGPTIPGCAPLVFSRTSGANSEVPLRSLPFGMASLLGRVLAWRGAICVPSTGLVLEYTFIITPIAFATMTKLIVVEDHALVREGLVQTLRQIEENVEIFAVADCVGANSLLEQEHQFDLMVLDLGLPGVDGLAGLRTFRQQYSAMPVVILSAYDDANTVSKAMKFGAAAFVPKTCCSDRLLSVLREVLAGGVVAPDAVLSPPSG